MIYIYFNSWGTYSVKIEKVSKKIKKEYIPEVKMDMDTIELTSIVLKSPNGTRFTIAVGDDGVLTATQIVLPN
jgi:hypothetical protein